jgi:hypothetical protein
MGRDANPNDPLPISSSNFSHTTVSKKHYSGARPAHSSQRTTRAARGDRPGWRPATHFSCSACLATAGGGARPCASHGSPNGTRPCTSRAPPVQITVARVDLACVQLATAGMELAHAQLAAELTPHKARASPAQCGDRRGLLHRSGDLRTTDELYTSEIHTPTSLHSPEQ